MTPRRIRVFSAASQKSYLLPDRDSLGAKIRPDMLYNKLSVSLSCNIISIWSTQKNMQSPRPILVLDFGSQYTQLIARRIREMHVYSVLVPCLLPFDELARMKPQAVILSGGPSSVYDLASPACDDRVFQLGVPILGICYGLQLMSYKLGGKVEPAARREYGFAQLEIN